MNSNTDQIVPRIVPLSALRDNYIWLFCEEHFCVLVDPGEASVVESFLARNDMTLSAILLTHRHADHQGGVARLLERYNPDVFGPDCSAMPNVTHPLSGGETLHPKGFQSSFKVLSTPGHTEEHLSYLCDDSLFCGDTLFAGGCGRLLGGTATELFESLNQIARLPKETRIYCAHEYTLNNLRFAAYVEPENPLIQARIAQSAQLREKDQPSLPSLLEDELNTNPFLRCAQASIQSSVEAQAGRVLHGPLDVFTELRKWKDTF